jgi:cytochrome P450
MAGERSPGAWRASAPAMKPIAGKLQIGRIDLRLFQSDPVRALYLMGDRFGPVVALRLANAIIYVVQHPDFARHLLQTKVANYRKSYGPIAEVFGDSILITQGEKWQKLRKLSQPAFATAKLKAMPPKIVAACDAVLERWAPAAGTGQAVDIGRDTQRITLNILLDMLFGADIESFGESLLDDVEAALVIAARFAWDITGDVRKGHPQLVHRFAAATKRITQLTNDFVRRRRLLERQPDDLLTRLLEARDDPDFPEMTDRQVRNEIVTFVIAGFETTATALAWTLRLVARHPEVQQRLKAEIEAVLGSREPGYEDLDRLPLASAVFSEAMRLYPPVPMLSRFAREADEYQGIKIPKDMQLTISVVAIHRRPELWERPREFWPDRFLPEHAQERYPFSYLPFSAGPRACIGNRFAMIEGPLTLVRLLQRFRFSAPPGEESASYVWSVSMRPKGGEHLLVERWD